MIGLDKHGAIIVRTAILTLGLILIAAGIANGELTEIMQKAIVVCLECIGIK